MEVVVLGGVNNINLIQELEEDVYGFSFAQEEDAVFASSFSIRDDVTVMGKGHWEGLRGIVVWFGCHSHVRAILVGLLCGRGGGVGPSYASCGVGSMLAHICVARLCM
jgi:hypothetical protein